MTTGWRAPTARLRHAPAPGSALSRSPGHAAGRPTARAADARTAPRPGRRRMRLIFVALMLGMLLAALDQTIVATALPTITGRQPSGRRLHLPESPVRPELRAAR
jgi:hypothetical protein